MNAERVSLLAALALCAAVAGAHTRLSVSTPADKAELDAAPQEISLEFSEPVRLTAVSLRGGDGKSQALGPLPGEAAATFNLSAPELGPGEYVVSWRALSADTHVMTGEFSFRIREPSS